jgi:hypothetical protein
MRYGSLYVSTLDFLVRSCQVLRAVRRERADCLGSNLVLSFFNTSEVLRRLVARIQILGLGEKFFLDQTGRSEAENRVGRTGLVVGTGSTRSTERLLADQSSSCLAVYRNISICSLKN